MESLKIMATEGCHEAAIDQILKLNLQTTTKFLDLGAGEGAFSFKLIQSGFKSIDAVDIRADKFKLSQCKYFNIDLNSCFSELIGEKYDFILGIEVIEHLENPNHFLRECFKLLNDRGYILITTPNIESWISRILFFRNGHFRWFSEKTYLTSGHITLLPSWLLIELAKKVGFNLVNFFTTSNRKLLKEILPYSNIFKKILKISTLIFLYPLMQGNKKGDISIFLFTKQF